MTYALSAIFMIVSLLMIMIILLQRGRGGGISAAFSGGGGGAGTAFGTKTGDVFTTATVILFAIFLLMAIGLNYTFQGEAPTPRPAATSNPATPVSPDNPTPIIPDLPAAPTRLPEPEATTPAAPPTAK